MRALGRVLVPEFGILMFCVGLAIFFRWINPYFLTPQSIAALLRGMSFLGLIIVGQTMLMISGELDLSVGAVAGLAAIAAAWLISSGGWNPLLGILAGIGVGAVVGFLNGVLAVKIGMPAFIVTLAIAFIARGFSYLISGGYPIYPIPKSIGAFGRAIPLGLSWAFFLFLITAAFSDFIMRYSVFGRMLYATGGNTAAAFRSGIRTDANKIACFVLTGTLSGFAGVLLMAQLGSGQPEIGSGWELEVIASVVIGGVSLFGGVGTVLGAVLGLLLIQLVRNGLLTTGVSAHWQTVSLGGIMLLAVGLDLVRRRLWLRSL